MNNQFNRSGNLRLTRNEANKALTILTVSGEPELMYEYLISKGDRYALLANGIITYDSYAGPFALNYLDEVMSEHGFDYDLDRIFYDMADAYIYKQMDRFEKGIDIIYGDINHKETMDFHTEVFEQYHLPPDAWTLYAVFNVMPQSRREPYWQSTLNAAGYADKEIVLSYQTFNFMKEVQDEGPPDFKSQADKWVNRVIDIDNAASGVYISAVKAYDYFVEPEKETNMDRINALIGETGNPLIDRGTDRFSFWDHPSRETSRFQGQTDWVRQAQFEHRNPLMDYYLERPSYMLPETGLFDAPSLNYRPDVGRIDSMVDQLRNGMSSMGSSSNSFNDSFTMPKMPEIPEFNYSGYGGFSSQMSF